MTTSNRSTIDRAALALLLAAGCARERQLATPHPDHAMIVPRSHPSTAPSDAAVAPARPAPTFGEIIAAMDVHLPTLARGVGAAPTRRARLVMYYEPRGATVDPPEAPDEVLGARLLARAEGQTAMRLDASLLELESVDASTLAHNAELGLAVALRGLADRESLDVYADARIPYDTLRRALVVAAASGVRHVYVGGAFARGVGVFPLPAFAPFGRAPRLLLTIPGECHLRAPGLPASCEHLDAAGHAVPPAPDHDAIVRCLTLGAAPSSAVQWVIRPDVGMAWGRVAEVLADFEDPAVAAHASAALFL